MNEVRLFPINSQQCFFLKMIFLQVEHMVYMGNMHTNVIQLGPYVSMNVIWYLTDCADVCWYYQ